MKSGGRMEELDTDDSQVSKESKSKGAAPVAKAADIGGDETPKTTPSSRHVQQKRTEKIPTKRGKADSKRPQLSGGVGEGEDPELLIQPRSPNRDLSGDEAGRVEPEEAEGAKPLKRQPEKEEAIPSEHSFLPPLPSEASQMGGSQLESSRYDSQMARLEEPYLQQRRRTGLKEPTTVHPRHVAIFTFTAAVLLGITVHYSRIDHKDKDFHIIQSDSCQWSSWASTKQTDRELCLCDDVIERHSKSGECKTERVRCADVPCPSSPLDAARAPFHCFCWNASPCRDPLAAEGSVMFLQRSRVRACPSVFWEEARLNASEGHYLFRSCDGFEKAKEKYDDIYECGHLHDLERGPFKDLRGHLWACKLHLPLHPDEQTPDNDHSSVDPNCHLYRIF